MGGDYRCILALPLVNEVFSVSHLSNCLIVYNRVCPPGSISRLNSNSSLCLPRVHRGCCTSTDNAIFLFPAQWNSCSLGMFAAEMYWLREGFRLSLYIFRSGCKLFTITSTTSLWMEQLLKKPQKWGRGCSGCFSGRDYFLMKVSFEQPVNYCHIEHVSGDLKVLYPLPKCCYCLYNKRELNCSVKSKSCTLKNIIVAQR